ncbi:GT2 family glycosyltransferase [Phycicoccus badiiscoriae]|uniref:GT2 family glycosyltransferase n=1 Tax=Pedococcus badiiscoriae TaxID=642776 RepID=A0A852WDW0_9MICO|nr:glycosyltransferase family 2 protein [Pedococcus badiiscoriae]NYG07393.1 GT2 family glycosyltransferase [Pedococcus badiiscoriae]
MSELDEAVRVTVVVVLFNSAPLLPQLVPALRLGLEGVRWTVVAVDNASADDSADVLRNLMPEAVVVETGRNGGYAAGINAGVAVASDFDAVLVLNPDVRLSQGCVGLLAEALRVPGTGIAVPRLTTGDGALIPSMRREPSLRRLLAEALIGGRRAGRLARLGEVVTDASAYEHPATTDWAEGSTQLISRECWDACGGWDESFFLYSEETDFGLRARDLGYGTRYVPEARAVHLQGGSAVTPALWALVARNRVRLYRRRNGPLRGAAFHAGLLVREATRAIIGRKPSRAATRELLRCVVVHDDPGPDVIARHRGTSR